MVQTIELDCAPGQTRPDAYISQVIEGLSLPLREPVAKFFGNWTWDYSDVPAELWDAGKEQRKARVEALYHSGAIRYGSW